MADGDERDENPSEQNHGDGANGIDFDHLQIQEAEESDNLEEGCLVFQAIILISSEEIEIPFYHKCSFSVKIRLQQFCTLAQPSLFSAIVQMHRLDSI
jgi:hypothetical protein